MVPLIADDMIAYLKTGGGKGGNGGNGASTGRARVDEADVAD